MKLNAILPAILGALVAARAATAVATTMTLDEALIKDILPPASTKCKGAEADGEFSFNLHSSHFPPDIGMHCTCTSAHISCR